MPIEKFKVEVFVALPTGSFLLLDVRSPGEFAHAHIPGSNNLPLFNDEERKVVGTAYKQQSREQAIKIGLSYFGPKMTALVEQVEIWIVDYKLQQPLKKDVSIVVHCWRGGMRSAGVAWLLDLYGYQVFTIAGGYKAYRNWVLDQFGKLYQFKVLGGYTGSGKTEILHALAQQGSAIIDLEKLAGHKGSAFGNLEEIKQPSQEMFENKLALELKMYGDKTIWIEDESQNIGNINIPPKIYQQKQAASLYFLDIPFPQRLQYIISGYGKFEKDKLMDAIVRIKKRLGGLDTKNALAYLSEDDLENCFFILLHYYDKFYLKGLHEKENSKPGLHIIALNTVDAIKNAQVILELN